MIPFYVYHTETSITPVTYRAIIQVIEFWKAMRVLVKFQVELKKIKNSSSFWEIRLIGNSNVYKTYSKRIKPCTFFFFIYILQYLFRVTICKLPRSSINIHYFYYLFLLLNTQDSVEENQTRKPNSLLTPVTPVTVASVCQSKVPARLRLTVLTTRMVHALLILHLQNRDST